MDAKALKRIQKHIAAVTDNYELETVQGTQEDTIIVRPYDKEDCGSMADLVPAIGAVSEALVEWGGVDIEKVTIKAQMGEEPQVIITIA